MTTEAVILNFRRGRHTQKTNQFLLAVEGIDSRSKAAQLIGKKILWKNPLKKKGKPEPIHGKIMRPHGNKGVVRARFSRGLPGQAIGTKVEIL